MLKVAVLGCGGQLGRCIQDRVKIMPEGLEFTFIGRRKGEGDKVVELTPVGIGKWLSEDQPDIIINCVAYTDVVRAEGSGIGDSYLSNFSVPLFLTNAGDFYAEGKNPYIIHVSTDFVFDGTKGSPYKPEDETNPQNHYGEHKRNAEVVLLDGYDKSIIIRTSWLYSEYRRNFVKKIIETALGSNSIDVVDDEIGSPTNAHDLADFIVDMVINGSYLNKHGIWHYCNRGACSRYDFAKAIIEYSGLETKILPTKSVETTVKRPKFTVLDVEDTLKDFGTANFIKIPDWRDSLRRFLKKG